MFAIFRGARPWDVSRAGHGHALSVGACATKYGGLLGDGKTAPAGFGNPNSGGSGNPNSGGSGNPNSGGSGNPNSGGSGNPNSGGSGTRTAADPGTRTAADPGTRTAADPGTRTAADPGTRTAADPGTRTAADPGTRTAAGRAAGSGTLKQPLGELVSVNVELAGLQGQPVLLWWTIFQKGGQDRLPGEWDHNFVAYRLEATTNDDTGTLEMWIPLPKQPGPYFIHLTMTTPDGISLASTTSDPFD